MILPAVLQLQLNYVLAVFHARPQRAWFFKFIVHQDLLPLLEKQVENIIAVERCFLQTIVHLVLATPLHLSLG